MEVPSLGHASTPAVNKYVYDLHTRHDNNLRLRSIEDHMARIEKLFLSLLSYLVPKCQLVGNNNYAETFVMEFPYFHSNNTSHHVHKNCKANKIAIIPIHYCHFWSHHHPIPSLEVNTCFSDLSPCSNNHRMVFRRRTDPAPDPLHNYVN